METGRSAVALVLAALERGDRPEESDLQRCLRSPWCPGALVERLAGTPGIMRSRRLVTLLLTHPACPRTFAWDALPALPWRDLVTVTRRPRTPPAVRKQAERKLVERLPQLTLGERTALARLAPRALIAALLTDADTPCVRALLDNGQFTEEDAVRLIGLNNNWLCTLTVLRHPRWGTSRAVKRAALRSPRVPLAVSMGLIATLSASEAEALVRSREVPEAVRAAARNLCEYRRGDPARRTRGAARQGSEIQS